MTRDFILCLSLSTALLIPATVDAQQNVQQNTQQYAQTAQPQQAAQGQRIPIISAEDAVKAGIARTAQQPFPALTDQEQAFVDQVLSVWEQRTAAVKRYSCQFQRWQFNSAIYAESYYTRASGELKYQAPDKGSFKVEQVETLASKGPPATYQVDPRRPYGEHWICDGEWVHILDHNEKKATKIQLPPDSRGELIARSPLPFLFGVKASEVKQRYWVRPIPYPAKPEELWLEVFPKFADDAGNYSRVQVVLDRADILPKGLIVFMPNWTEQQQNREVYQFNDRETNKVMDALRERLFLQDFIETKLGSDWEIVEEPYIPPQNVAQPGQGVANPTQRMATPPNQPPRR